MEMLSSLPHWEIPQSQYVNMSHYPSEVCVLMKCHCIEDVYKTLMETTGTVNYHWKGRMNTSIIYPRATKNCGHRTVCKSVKVK